MTAPDWAQRRAPLAVRVLIGLCGVAVLLFNVALMMSDRAPGITRRLFGGFAERLADRLDASGTVDAADLPGNDAIVHIGVWAAATLLVVLTVWRWTALLPVAVAVFGASVVVEIGQGRYSSSRAVEVSDVLANAVGVAIGTGGAVACMAVWSAISRVAGGSSPPRR